VRRAVPVAAVFYQKVKMLLLTSVTLQKGATVMAIVASCNNLFCGLVCRDIFVMTVLQMPLTLQCHTLHKDAENGRKFVSTVLYSRECS
jgi:hypothetical protein